MKIKDLFRNRGFTLIELTIVILLISILIGLSTPLFRRTFSGIELKNAAYDIAKIINYSQDMAETEKANYRINFDFDKGRYWITRMDTGKKSPAYKRIEGRYGRIFSIPRGYFLTGEKREIAFYPDGRSEKALVKILDKKGLGYILRIETSGRYVTVEAPPDEE